MGATWEQHWERHWEQSGKFCTKAQELCDFPPPHPPHPPPPTPPRDRSGPKYSENSMDMKTPIRLLRLLRVSESEDSLEPAGHMWEK